MHIDLRVLAIGFLDSADDVVCRLRLKQGSHVLQGNRIRTHVQQASCLHDVSLDVMKR